MIEMFCENDRGSDYSNSDSDDSDRRDKHSGHSDSDSDEKDMHEEHHEEDGMGHIRMTDEQRMQDEQLMKMLNERSNEPDLRRQI